MHFLAIYLFERRKFQKFLQGVIQPLRNGLRREGGSLPSITPIVLNNRLKVKSITKGEKGQKMAQNGVT